MVTFVAVSALASNTQTGNLPAGIIAGDVLLWLGNGNTGGTAPSPPSGWQTLFSNGSGATQCFGIIDYTGVAPSMTGSGLLGGNTGIRVSAYRGTSKALAVANFAGVASFLGGLGTQNCATLPHAPLATSLVVVAAMAASSAGRTLTIPASPYATEFNSGNAINPMALADANTTTNPSSSFWGLNGSGELTNLSIELPPLPIASGGNLPLLGVG